MKLWLYVEDSNHEVYEILAKKWHETDQGRCEVNLTKAVTLRLDRMRDGMRKHVILARKSGFNCVVFVLDREASHERPVLVNDIRAAFERLCQELPNDRELQGMRVGLIVAKSCLECWLLTEVQAIIRFACRRGKHVTYSPPQSGETEKFSPNEAITEITHILREIRRKAGRHDVKRSKYEKSESTDIAREMSDLSQAVGRNRSLAYFCEMVTCERSGCDYPQSDNEF